MKKHNPTRKEKESLYQFFLKNPDASASMAGAERWPESVAGDCRDRASGVFKDRRLPDHAAVKAVSKAAQLRDLAFPFETHEARLNQEHRCAYPKKPKLTRTELRNIRSEDGFELGV